MYVTGGPPWLIKRVTDKQTACVLNLSVSESRTPFLSLEGGKRAVAGYLNHSCFIRLAVLSLKRWLRAGISKSARQPWSLSGVRS